MSCARESIVFGLGLFGLGCGTPLATGDDPGTPAIVVHGIATGMVDQQLVSPSVAIVWEDIKGDQVSITGDLAPLASTDLTTAFSLDVFDPPPDEVIEIVEPSTVTDAELGFGYLFAFDDVDRSGGWTIDASGSSIAPDVFIGFADTAVLLVKTAPPPGSEFFETQVSTTDPTALFATADQLTPGYHLIQRVCTAGVPFGAAHYVIVDPTTVIAMELVVPNVALPSSLTGCSILPP